MRKLISAVLCAAAMLGMSVTAGASAAPSVSAQSAIVISSGGEVVFEKNADQRSLIASTTKIMTAIVVIENTALDEALEIQPQWCGLEGSSMYLEPGQRYTVRELVTGLLLVSGNDAALALACHSSGSEEGFVKLMNQKARELGMNDTQFENPHGLNADSHYSTARDMARLMAYCMQNEDFAKISSIRSCTVGEQTLINHNKLLGYNIGCIGGKTGYTQAAGRCLVSCCERDGTRLICVTLAAPDDWRDHEKLYRWAYSQYSTRDVSEGLCFEVPVVSGEAASVRVVPEELRLFLPSSAELVAEAAMPNFVFAPVEAGEPAGIVCLYLDGQKLAEARLLYEESVAQIK